MVEENDLRGGMIDALPLGVIILDRGMHVVHLNPAAEELTGYAPRDVAGRSLPELFGPDLWAEESALRQAMETDERVEPRSTMVASTAGEAGGASGQRSSPEQAASTAIAGPMAGNAADRPGRRCFLVGAAPFGAGYLLSLQKASPFYQVEADRVSDISHDIRGPLASIQAYTELLVDEVDQGDPELRRQFLDVINQRTRHLTDLIVNLTCLVRWNLGCFDMTRTRVSLREATSKALDACQLQASAQNVELTLDAADDQHLVLADRDALSTLLRNVVDNAIKFSRAEDDVVVSLRRVGEEQVVTVTDSGLGIAPEDLPHIFETFYRGRNAVAAGVEGSGLGLPLVKVIAEAHGGEVDMESEEGKGTRLTVRLPAEGSSPRRS
jgi:signal transduction histidine kinase